MIQEDDNEEEACIKHIKRAPSPQSKKSKNFLISHDLFGLSF